MKTFIHATLATLAVSAAVPASAAIVTSVSNSTITGAGTNWGKISGDNSADSSAQITNAAARSGNGSLELKGNTTRVQTGYQYSLFTTKIDALSAINGLTFDWQVAADSTNQSMTPALRLLIQNGSTRSQLIWEGAYNPSALGTNGTAATNPTGEWYSTSTTDLFWQNVTGAGDTLNGSGGYVLKTLADWISGYGSGAYVSAISVGNGSGSGTGYHAFVDNVTLYGTNGTSRSYNFETASAPVPEPATWAMMIAGFGLVGGAMRRRSTKVSFA